MESARKERKERGSSGFEDDSSSRVQLRGLNDVPFLCMRLDPPDSLLVRQ